jgi:2-polyprenyl-6-hydroxyphenyl methylase/3-demethylubiquinone-9 3-methyltransferase
VANALSNIGWNVTGVDPSIEGITIANQSYPTLQLELGSAYDDLFSRYGQFPIVISLEVVEHVYFPRQYATTLFNLVEPGGTAIISTPYHGYWKNLVIAIFGKMDKHFTALWDNGHIKFWSVKTLRILLRDAGFKNIRFTRVGRISPFAKSMVAIANKP